MAAQNVNVETAYHGTLTAATADTVCIVQPISKVTIVNRGTTEIYFSVGSSLAPGASPTVAGNNFFVVPGTNGASVSVTVPQESSTPPLGAVIKLISTGTPGYSVEALA